MSSSQNMSRKRPAPGTTPPGFSHQPQQYQSNFGNNTQDMSDDQFLTWGANGQDANMYANPPMYNLPQNTYPTSNQVQPSTQLARRPVSQMVTRPPAQASQWMPEQASTPVQQPEANTNWTDDIDELVTKAQAAKRDSLSKRKQIPPFVLKLHRQVKISNTIDTLLTPAQLSEQS